MEPIVSTIWQRSKLLIKALLIGVLTLALMIPAYFVENLIKERQARQEEAFAEISSKWAGSQTLTGPVLVLPFLDRSIVNTGTRRLAYLLPENLVIKSTVSPEKRYRGIYEVMLYSSTINLNGKFNFEQLRQLKIDPADVLWQEAYTCMAISDPKGLKEDISMKWNDSILTLAPTAVNNAIMREAYVSPVLIEPGREINFSSVVELNGSRQLLFTPVGKMTTVTLNSTWPDPSFTGGLLPDHQITKNGFSATWKSQAHTRPFPQSWIESSYNLQTASFGADLFIAVNGYQKTMRSIKYAILCILLTFAAFFIIETVNQRSVHPFQYALIGLALILFYTLLLSFSEYIGFNIAYLISSIATIALIAWFVKGLLQSTRLSTLLSIVLLLVYSYVFSILQLQDYSLILGSVGLFLTLGVIMHFSKKIKW